MENTQEQKTPEQWFQMLKEPYRSEAIKGINKEVVHFKEYPESLLDALYFSLYWTDVPNEKATRKDWGKIYNSIKAGETTYLEPETLKPEQMESGKWYVVDTFLIKFEKIEDERIYRYKSFDLECKLNFSNIRDGFLCINGYEKIRPATKEVVLKYFPDEVFEPIELRPKEPTDWKAMYHELKAKYDQLQPKCEKVYFYFDYLDNLIKTTDFEFALHESSEDSPIYKGVFMGKKKSVLVNE